MEVSRTRWETDGVGAFVAEGLVVGPEWQTAEDVALRIVGPSGGQAYVRALEVGPSVLRAAPEGEPFTARFVLPDAVARPGHRFDVVARGAGLAPRRRPRPRGRFVRALPVAGLVCGALLVADGAATVLWQEPFSGVYAHYRQAGLRDQLGEVNRLFGSPAEARAAAAKPRVAAARRAAPKAAPKLRTGAETDIPGVATASVGGPGPAKDEIPVSDAAPAAPHDFAADAHWLRTVTGPGDPIGHVRIPSIDADFVLVEGTGTASLREGPGHYTGTALPGEAGTVGIAGHRTTYLAPFRRIDSLALGDAIELTLPYGRFRYLVEGTAIVTPDRAEVLRSAPGKDRLVLTACHPLSSSALRIVVWAGLDNARST
jgi:sortase A